MRPLALAVLLSCSAFADVPEPLVERGTYLGVGVGPHGFVSPPIAPQRVIVGYGLSLEARYAPWERLAFSVLMMSSGMKGGAQAQGDILAVTPAFAVRLNTFGVIDRFDVRRLWVYLRAGAGYTLFWPQSVMSRGAPVVFASLGLEYRTHLRHFALGLEATPIFYPTLNLWSFAVTPSLQFAF